MIVPAQVNWEGCKRSPGPGPWYRELYLHWWEEGRPVVPGGRNESRLEVGIE